MNQAWHNGGAIAGRRGEVGTAGRRVSQPSGLRKRGPHEICGCVVEATALKLTSKHKEGAQTGLAIKK